MSRSTFVYVTYIRTTPGRLWSLVLLYVGTATFRTAMGPELDRRAKLLADAVKLRKQRRP